MFAKGSRYETTKLFAPAQDDVRLVRPRDIGPSDGVLEHRVEATDRLDLLALHYYNDNRLWYRILDANPELLCGSDLSLWIGRTLAIPRARG